MRRNLLGMLPAGLLAVTSRGDGLRRPLNAPGAQQTPIGIQPGSTGITIAHIIIVTGPGGGVFIYNGTPGPGNPPVAWVSNGTSDPYGNTLPDDAQMGVAGTGTFAAGNTLITPAGVYVYDPSIAAGNLLISMNDTPGTSPTGDTVPLGGLVSYGTAGAVSALLQGRLVLNAADTSYITISGAGTMTARSITESWLFDMPVQDIFALKPGTVHTEDDWQSPAPALLNSWANNASFGKFNYRKVSSPANSVEVTGAISAAAATSATFFTLPSGYIPNSPGGRPCGTNTGNAGATAVAQVRWDASGNLSVASNAAVPNGATYLFGFTIPLGAN